MKKITQKIRSKDGLSYPFTVCLVLVLLIIVFGVCEVIRLNIISANIRNKFQAVIISETTDNFNMMYGPVRDGYAASYQYNGGWRRGSRTTRQRIYNSLNVALNEGEKEQLRIVSVDFSTQTSSVAPTDAYNAVQFNVRGQVGVSIPYRFLWAELPPIRLTINVSSSWRQMF